jgi:uncharacterized alkaline shock family protein YloU
MARPRLTGHVQPTSVVVAQAIRDAVLRIPGVAGLSAGLRYVEATYGHGVTVLGVGISVLEGQVEADVHVVATATPLPALASQVRQVVQGAIRQTAVLPPGRVNVYVDDIVLEERQAQEAVLP